MKGGESQKVVAMLANVQHDKYRLSPAIVRPVLEANRADIQWMEARLGQSLYEELGEYRRGDVRDEADLLQPDPEVVRKLLALLGDAAPAGIKGETPEEVAVLVHALRESRDNQVGILIEQIRKTNPRLLDGIPTNRAEALVTNVFKHMNDTLAGTQEGVVSYMGLGQFRVKHMEKEVGGKKTARKQIVFHRAGRSKASMQETHHSNTKPGDTNIDFQGYGEGHQ